METYKVPENSSVVTKDDSRMLDGWTIDLFRPIFNFGRLEKCLY